MNRHLWVLLAQSSNKFCSGSWFENTSHVLETKNMSSHVDDLVSQLHVIFEVVLLLWVQHVTTVTHCTFSYTTCFEHSLDTDFELFNVIESIKDTENINTILLCLFAEVINGIIRK